MGTSISQRSPRVGAWQAVERTYQFGGFPLSQTVQLIWRAAGTQESGWDSALGGEEVAKCFELAATRTDPREALREAVEFMALEGRVSLAGDIAKRALVRSFGTDDRAGNFVSSLFAEATNYLVSRDLHGFVGTGHLESVSQAAKLKADICEEAATRARTFNPPAPANLQTWRQFAARTLASLRGPR